MCGAPTSILLVDDDLDTQVIVAMIINHFKYSLTIASTAQDALNQLSKSMPDIVMLDILLPDISGYAALGKIRDLSSEHPPKIIAITAYYTTDTAAKMLDYGFDGYLQKPIIAATLIPCLQNQVSNN